MVALAGLKRLTMIKIKGENIYSRQARGKPHNPKSQTFVKKVNDGKSISRVNSAKYNGAIRLRVLC